MEASLNKSDVLKDFNTHFENVQEIISIADAVKKSDTQFIFSKVNANKEGTRLRVKCELKSDLFTSFDAFDLSSSTFVSGGGAK